MRRPRYPTAARGRADKFFVRARSWIRDLPRAGRVSYTGAGDEYHNHNHDQTSVIGMFLLCNFLFFISRIRYTKMSLIFSLSIMPCIPSWQTPYSLLRPTQLQCFKHFIFYLTRLPKYVKSKLLLLLKSKILLLSYYVFMKYAELINIAFLEYVRIFFFVLGVFQRHCSLVFF